MFYPIIALLLTFFVSAQDKNDLIDWSLERRLTWEDFKGQPDVKSPNAALTSSNIKVAFGYNRSALQYNIQCRFDKLHSWVRLKNDYILVHEQGHFDIAEIHARILNKLLSEYKFNSKTVGEDVNKIYNQVMQMHQSFQLEYDAETDHSRDAVKQKVWQNKINDLLKEYSQYGDYRAD